MGNDRIENDLESTKIKLKIKLFRKIATFPLTWYIRSYLIFRSLSPMTQVGWRECDITGD